MCRSTARRSCGGARSQAEQVQCARENGAEEMTSVGIQGILNFAPVRLNVGDVAEVTSVDLSRSLEQLAYQVAVAD